jgi:hypothetical protein
MYHKDWDIRPFSKIEESRTVANAVESARNKPHRAVSRTLGTRDGDLCK